MNKPNEQQITYTLEQNFMPYAMSVIISRAIPEIDGFKPSQRKLLYTMYKMGLLSGARTKSANVVGQTMRLNPHGEGAIYDTMVRLSRGCEALLHPFVDSKGNFGKAYSRDMACAASRYTEVKLDAVASEIFRDIDNDTVDFIPNYDNTTTEPILLPTTFPNILVSSNVGIAVGMASTICSFNLREVCETTAAYLKNPDCDLFETLLAPDFSTGGELVFEREEMLRVYETGRGSFKLRAKWRYVKKENCIEVFEIPYTTTVEAIIDKIAELIKSGRIREVSDIRDETDLSGLKIAIDLKRGVDPDKLMQKLMKMTPLMDSFSANFNVLIAGTPRMMGIRELLGEWSAWRQECVRRRLHFELSKLRDRLHLLKGLKKILLDIDRAISIIRETEEEVEVVPNLMIGFGIDELQADYIAEIRLRNINKEYILKRVAETDELERKIEETEGILGSREKVRTIIISELRAVAKKHGIDRKTDIVYGHEVVLYNEEEHIEDYPVTYFLSKESYFKKITPQSLRMSNEQKYKDNDGPLLSLEGQNRDDLLIFTSNHQVYKIRGSDFEDGKASVLGDFLPQSLGMDAGETAVFMANTADYSGSMLFIFENGKAARVPLESYATKTNRKKLTGAYSSKSPLVAMFHIKEDCELILFSSAGRALVFHTASLEPKSSRETQGVQVQSVKGRHHIVRAEKLSDSSLVNAARFRTRTMPAAGAVVRPEDIGEEQISIE